jgi:hypothetical protein
MGREWELSFRLGMRPWIAVAYSAPVAAATAVFLIYPIGQGSFSDGYVIIVLVALLVPGFGKTRGNFVNTPLFFPTAKTTLKRVLFSLFLKLKVVTQNWSNLKVEFYLKGEHPTFCFRTRGEHKHTSISTKCQGVRKPSGPPGNSNQNTNGENPDPKKDNPLLKNNSKLVTGERFAFENYNVSMVENKSTVYGIYCKQTDKYAVGETKNFKRRSQTHFNQLTTGMHKNKELQNDFNKYGLSSFEFVVYQSGSQLEDNNVRKNVQDTLIELINSKEASYTSGLSETIEPRFLGKLPSKAGVFYIYCKTTGRYYYGHTAQVDGISGRVRSIVAGLKRNEFGNRALQQDWSIYGEGDFEITPFVYGDAYADEKARVKVVNKLVYDKYTTNPNSLYNTQFVNLKDQPGLPLNTRLSSGLIGPLPQQQAYQPSPTLTFTPDLAKYPGAKPICLADRKPIYAEGSVYLSIKEAANSFGVNQNVITEKVNGSNPEYRFATEPEIQAELERRGWSISSTGAVVKIGGPTTTKGIPKQIVVERKLFQTMAAAAAHYGVSPNSVKKWPKTGNKKSFFPIDYPMGRYPIDDWNPPKSD